MNKNSFFSIKRFTRLLHREAHINLKRDLLIIGAIYSLFTIVIFLVFEFGEDDIQQEVLESFHFVVFIIMLFIGGAFITSFSFIELRDKLKSHFYLLTPGSSFEKFIVNILISLIGYILFMVASYLIYSTIFNWVVLGIYNHEFSGINIFSEDFIIVIQVFILVQSIFFLGSTTFKKYPVVFTSIAGFLLIALLSLATELIGKIVFPDIEFKNQFFEISIDDFVKKHEAILKLGLFYILPVILWFTAYLKLNEKEY